MCEIHISMILHNIVKCRKYARYQLNSFKKNNHNKLKQKIEYYPTNITILKEQNAEQNTNSKYLSLPIT